MLRKFTAFVPRYRKFESISLQQTVCLSSQPLSKVANPAFGAGLRGWLGDRVGRDAGMF